MMNVEYTAEQIEAQRAQCIAAYAAGLPQIVIEVDTDFTPKGKRSARIIHTDRNGRQLRWYVSGRIYREFGAITNEAAAITRQWLAN